MRTRGGRRLRAVATMMGVLAALVAAPAPTAAQDDPIAVTEFAYDPYDAVIRVGD